MEIEIEYSERKRKTVEVEFPLFICCEDSFDSGGWYSIEIRIDADATRHEIKETDQGWEFEVRKTDLKQSLGEMLRENQYYYRRSKAEDFYKSLNKLKAALAKVPELA